MLTEVNKKEKIMISNALEEYLKNMYILEKQNNEIRVTDVANKMNCSKPSVNKALNNLKEEKLVNYETYGTIELTSEGENLAKKILEAYDIVYLFLRDVLNLEDEQAKKGESTSNDVGNNDEPEDEFYNQAVDLVRRQQTASVSMLQRRFRIGYNRAARIVDEMEAKGIVGPSEGSKPRQVLVPPVKNEGNSNNANN